MIESPCSTNNSPGLDAIAKWPDAGGVDGYGRHLFRQGGDQLGLLVKDIGAPPLPRPN